MYQPQLGVVPTYYTFTIKVRVRTKTEKFSPGSAPLAPLLVLVLLLGRRGRQFFSEFSATDISPFASL